MEYENTVVTVNMETHSHFYPTSYYPYFTNSKMFSSYTKPSPRSSKSLISSHLVSNISIFSRPV